MAYFNRNTFYRGTAAMFSRASVPERTPDYVSSTGSRYWFSDQGVIRLCDHWSPEMESCCWLHEDMGTATVLCGFAAWEAFQLRIAAIAA